MLVVPTPSVMEPLAQTPQFALMEPSPGSKPPESLISASAVAPPLAEVHAPANPSVGTAARTAGCPLEVLCSVMMKGLGWGGGGTSLGRLSALRPERASVSLDSLPWW